MNPEGFEPPTFGSGIRRAAVAPWARGVFEPGSTFLWTALRWARTKKKQAPPLGIEPRTCRLTADRSANGALEALDIVRSLILFDGGGIGSIAYDTARCEKIPEPMAQRQRVGFQTQRLGVQIPLGSILVFV